MLLKLTYGLEENEFEFTRAIKDGGKDAIIERLISSDVLNRLKITAWVEAKYRQENNVDLGDIGGNVIIASNSSVHSVFFVTNQFFTQQAIEQLLIFQVRTGLQIELIDGYRYRNLLQKHFESIQEQKLEISKLSKLELIEFAKNLLDNLPTRPPKIEYKVNLIVERGKITKNSKAGSLSNNEINLERRALDLSSIIDSKETLSLSKARMSFVIPKNQIEGNPNYELLGINRKDLFRQTITLLESGNIVVIKGGAGQGKTFFSHHIARVFYESDKNVIFIDIENHTVQSLTRAIIIEIIGIDYFKYLQDREAVLEYLSSYYAIDSFVATKVISLVQEDKTYDEITDYLCLKLLLKLFKNITTRKPSLMIVDNFHKASRNVVTFLKNLFIFLKQSQIPVLVLTRDESIRIKNLEADWLEVLDDIIDSNHFVRMVMPKLNKEDRFHFIQLLAPGVSKSFTQLIESVSFDSPLFIKLIVDFLKSERIIMSKDDGFWVLGGNYSDSFITESAQIEYLVVSRLKRLFGDQLLRRIAQVTFLFNNQLPESIFRRIFPNIDYVALASSDLFYTNLTTDGFIISFNHDLYYENLKGGLRNPIQELNIQSTTLLSFLKKENLINNIQDDILGTLFEHSGQLDKAHECFLKYAKKNLLVDGFKSIIYFEKALECFLIPKIPVIGDVSRNETIADIIFRIFPLYNRYNLLSRRKSKSLFGLLKRLNDIQCLNSVQQLTRLYFIGLKETKEENFWYAKQAYEEALEQLDNSPDVPSALIDNIISQYGINLKHVGKKDDSLIFFDSFYRKTLSERVKHQKYSNEAAYYLTSNPKKSLQRYEFIRDSLSKKDDIHLMVDFGMVYFYLKKYDSANEHLKLALQKAREQSDLSEEARAENILGVLSWQRGERQLAEEYFDLAASNCELANNHRWLWRIRTNQAQVALENQNQKKAYNIGWTVLQHLNKTKTAISNEITQSVGFSRRYASLKAVLLIYYKLGKYEEIENIIDSFNISELVSFWEKLKKNGNNEFDRNDSNLYGERYYILG
ncbi:restriction endonuclease [Muricauda sp. SCSIO 64092]|nr:restriction endonuclease [Muricauda sp. SCSIO 64092]